MNHAQIKAILDGAIPEVKAFIAEAQKPILERIVQLESRELVKGEKGDPGDRGADGQPGRDAIDGKDGPPGERGLPGELSLAPDDVADQIAATIALIAESPIIQRSAGLTSITTKIEKPVMRTFQFERDENNNIIAAHEGDA